MELMAIDDKSYEMLEQFHSHSAKLYQGIPKHAANVVSISTIDWTSITSKLLVGYCSCGEYIYFPRVTCIN